MVGERGTRRPRDQTECPTGEWAYWRAKGTLGGMGGSQGEESSGHCPSFLPHLCACPPYRLLATSDDDLPGDLQSLSWLTAVDVPRLQQMASGRMDLGGPSAPPTLPGGVRNKVLGEG